MNKKMSLLEFYSIGIVAANKVLNSKRIEVTPIEHFPLLDGEVTDNATTTTASSVDHNGASQSTELVSTATIPATWLPMCDSNRLTAPDVRIGDIVAIYQFADQDKFWWTTLKNDKKIRKLETVTYGFSNVTDPDVEMTEENTYWFQISTHKQLIALHTANNNGELTTFDIQVNTKDGIFVVATGLGHYFEVHAGEDRIRAQIDDANYFELVKGKFTGKTEEGYLDMNKVTFTGSVDIKDGLKVGGSTQGSGWSMTANGSLSTKHIDNQGTINSTGNITAPNI